MLRLWYFSIVVDILGIADMVVVAAVDGRKSWNENGGMVGYISMIAEKMIDLSVIDDDCNVGKNVDVDEERRHTPMVVVMQQHCSDDHHKEMVPTNNFHKEEGISVVCLSNDHCILFLFCDQAVAVYDTF